MNNDPYATRSTDDAGEPLCTAPESPPIAQVNSVLFNAAAGITRAGAGLIDHDRELLHAAATRVLGIEYTKHLPPALPPTV